MSQQLSYALSPRILVKITSPEHVISPLEPPRRTPNDEKYAVRRQLLLPAATPYSDTAVCTTANNISYTTCLSTSASINAKHFHAQSHMCHTQVALRLLNPRSWLRFFLLLNIWKSKAAEEARQVIPALPPNPPRLEYDSILEKPICSLRPEIKNLFAKFQMRAVEIKALSNITTLANT